MSVATPEIPAPDALTGLPGRVACEAGLSAALARARASEGALSLAVIDIDLFGSVNESHGRAAGDRVIQSLARALTESLAARNGSAAVYRFGGDALAVVLEGVEKERTFLELERFRASMAALGAAAPVTVSAGVSAYPDDGSEAGELTLKANEALYRAKVGGRDRVCLAREEPMKPKTSHYRYGQLLGLRRLAEREGIGEAVLLREALNDLLRKHNA